MRGWNEVHGVACAVCHAPTDADGCINHKPDCTDEARMAFVNEWRENRITELEAENKRLHHERAEDVDRMERAAECIEKLNAECNRLAGLPVTRSAPNNNGEKT